MYLGIPSKGLEIHPGRFFYGTHHTLGQFQNRSIPVKHIYFCDACLPLLLEEACFLDDTWYYPIMNCETLTRALTQSYPLSIQTILSTGIFTTLILGIAINSYILFLTIFFILLLLAYNNLPYKFLPSTCIHL